MKWEWESNKFEKDRKRFHAMWYIRVLPPFLLIRDFGKQNIRGNGSKISRQSYVLTTYRIEIHQSQPASMT